MKLLKQVYQSVLHLNASSDKSRLTLLIESTFVWIACRASLTKIKSYRQRKSTNQFSIHTLVSHMDIPFYIIGIYSFLRYLSNNPRLIIYDDGTLIKEDYLAILDIPRVSIVRPSQASRRAIKTFGKINDLLRQRESTPYNRKMIDVLLYKENNKKLLLLDSDVVFFRYPDALLKFLADSSKQIDMIYMKDVQNAYVAPVRKLNQVFHTRFSPQLNSGVLAFRTDFLTIPFVSGYYHKLHTSFGKKLLFSPWIEQTGYALLSASVQSKPLPKGYSIGDKWNKETICKHYVHGARTDYVMDLLKLSLLTLRII